MGQLVTPRVYLVGCTGIDATGLKAYLKHTDQLDFWETYQVALAEGISGGEALCSVFAKLCYKSLVKGKNSNVKRVRNIEDNIESCHDTGHGSVFEHCWLNFIITDCSRVFTHELVRHRVGTAFSQTSGRYCRLDKIDLVWSYLLDPVKDLWLRHLAETEKLVYITECALGLRKPNPKYPNAPFYANELSINEISSNGWFDSDNPNAREELKWLPDDSFNMDKRKAITSAIRRIAPNGQSNEMGFSVNIRALRQLVQLRTARFAETEIRDVFGQIFTLVKQKFPTIFYRAKTRLIDGLAEVYGMRMQPFEIEAGNPQALEHWETNTLRDEVVRRDIAAHREDKGSKETPCEKKSE